MSRSLRDDLLSLLLPWVSLNAIERGELAPTTDFELALDLLYGPLWHRLLHGHAPLSERFVRDLVDTVVAGLTSVRLPSGPDRR